ncbi:unnamed protein product [marine sediment metagenome]|uniref:Uncharacterized protein n=1 Tax=marine sediment metagenome TaxID=412755 RepID=X0ZJ35_9ZZZZ
MFDIVRRRSYDERRVLIDSARVLDSPFDDSLVYLTGAQQELLRNLTQYLHRQDTFVATYCAQHYLTPDVDAWDAIQAIVSDLEDVLMGNPNTIWGYKDVFVFTDSDSSMDAGDNTIWGPSVPAGEVWRISNMSFVTDSAICTSVKMRAYIDGTYIDLTEVVTPTIDLLYDFPIDVVLKEGDRPLCTFYDLAENDFGRATWSGYKMDVT